MADYTELVKDLLHCATSSEACTSCNRKNERYCQDNLHTEAADAIEQLQKSTCPYYIRNVHDSGDDSLCDKHKCEANALPRWIPVTERLPLLMTPVLITDGIEVDIAWMFGVPARWAAQYTDMDVDSITHWMELPQTPKEET